MTKKGSLTIIFGIAFVFIMMASSFTAVHASTPANTLPTPLENILQAMHPNATATELNQIRTQWANQLAINQQHAPDSRSAFAPAFVPSGGCYFGTIVKPEHYLGGQIIGQPSVILGPADNVYCELLAPGLNDFAAICGTWTSATAHGQIYSHVLLSHGAATWGTLGNYLICLASNDIDADPRTWPFIGYVNVQGETSYWAYTGYSSSSYTYWNFGVWTAGGQVLSNDIYLDSVWAQYT
jgi:hypothetical protein